MFLTIGLVLGSLVGLATSLIRFRQMTLALAFSNVVGLFVGLLILAGIVAAMRSSGEAVTAVMTALVLGVAFLAVTVIIGFLLGALMKAMNRQPILNNARTILFDVALLGVTALFFNAFVLSPISQHERSRQEDYRKTMDGRIKDLSAQLPVPYKGAEWSMIRSLDGQVNRREINLAPATVEKIREIVRAQDDYQASYLHPYREDAERQSDFGRAFIASWFVSVFLWPLILRRFVRPQTPPPPVIRPFEL